MAQRAAALKSDAPKSKVQAAVRKVDAQLAEAEARREQERAKAAEQLRTKLQQAEEKRLILAKIAEQNAAAEAERRRIEFERHPLVTPPLPPLSPDDIIFT
jgi:recombinational DNA repair ATPase RecF